MSDQYSLQVRIGDAEFSAEGPENTVRQAYEDFLNAISEGVVARATQKADEGDQESDEGADGVTDDILDSAFKVDRQEGVVSLRLLPPGDGKQKKADAAILIIYGHETLLDRDHAPVMELNEGLRQSGLTVKRLDRFIDTHKGLYMKGGTRSGGRYSLTNHGRRWAEEKLVEMFG